MRDGIQGPRSVGHAGSCNRCLSAMMLSTLLEVGKSHYILTITTPNYAPTTDEKAETRSENLTATWLHNLCLQTLSNVCLLWKDEIFLTLNEKRP